MIKDLKNKVAIITGASGILGKQFSESLIHENVTVVMADLHYENIEKAADEIAKKLPNAKIYPVVCDVTDSASVKNMVTETIDKYGEINILINNAATKTDRLEDFFTPFEEYDIDIWKKVMSVNLDGMFLVAQAVGKEMLKQEKGGSIIQMSSIYGVVAPDARIYENSSYLGVSINTPAVYAASKSGVIGFTRYLAVHWAKNNIRVNCISPGGIASGQNEIFQKNYSGRVPMGRMGSSTELSKAVLFLASEASSYITGQNIIIDGGLTCW